MIHPNSPLGQFERMYNTRLCPLCLICGGLVVKSNGKAICNNHMVTKPKGFRCSIYKENSNIKCYYKQDNEGICPEHGINLIPYWDKLPDSLMFLKGKPRLAKLVYAQLVSGRGKERGLTVIEEIASKFKVSSWDLLAIVGECESYEKALSNVK